MGVCFPVVLLHWSLSNIRVYILETDRQHLIHMNRQVTLNIACVAEKMKQYATADILYISYSCAHTHRSLHLPFRRAAQTKINSLLEVTQTFTLPFFVTHKHIIRLKIHMARSLQQ